DHVRGSRTSLERVVDHRDGPASIEHLTFEVVPAAAARADRLLSGTASAVKDLSLDDLDRVRADPRLVVTETLTARSIYGQIDLRHAPFKDIRVRRALNHAVDRRAI